MMSTQNPLPCAALLAMDAASLAVAMIGAYYVRIEGRVIPYHGYQDMAGYFCIGAVILPAWLAIHVASRLYHPDVVGVGSEEYFQIFRASAFGVVIMTMLSFWDRTLILSRGWILLSWLFSLTLLIAGRFCLRRVLLRARRRGRYCSCAVIVGADQRALTIAEQFVRNPSSGVRVAAFLDDVRAPGTEVMAGICAWGSPDRLAEAVGTLGAVEVFIVADALDWETLQGVMRDASALPDRVRVRLCPKLGDLWTVGVKLGKKAEIAVLTFSGMRITGGDAVLKRVTDCILAAVFLVAAMPVGVVISALLRFVDGVPVLDRHRVFGLRGRPFHALKFHTGLLGTTQRTFRSSSSSSVRMGLGASTAIGRFLYRTGLGQTPATFECSPWPNEPCWAAHGLRSRPGYL